ncbi:hypothetical protein N0V90_008763 [Kalmusia sp. IMI 367209]|nr:hypothetical protein N0V90_008763 [Kalmusia sp. IMI 367209]
MAKDHVSASTSVLQVSGAWWKMLAQALSRKKNGGAINWPLADVTIVFVLASLAISSISSSFLTTKDTTIFETVQLQKRVPKANSPLQLNASPDVFLGTTGALIYNSSVDPWTLGAYTVLPFWPEGSDTATMLEGGEHNKKQSWKTTTSVFRTQYRCISMDTKITLNNTKHFSTRGYRFNTTTAKKIWSMVNGTSKMDTTVLSSTDGCSYQIDMSPTLMVNRLRSAVWGRAADPLYDIGMGFSPDQDAMNKTQGWIYSPGPYAYTLDTVIDFKSPLLRHNRSAACVDKDIIHLSTELVDPDAESFRKNYSQKAWECQLDISTADIPVTLLLSEDGSELTFDHHEFSQKESLIGHDLLNNSDVRRILHQSNWLSYLNPAIFKTDRSALLLSAEYDYEFDRMISDNALPDKLQSTVETFFAALLQSSLAVEGASETEATSGINTMVKPRVEVFEGTGIALSILYGLCALLLAALAWQCTASHRSLNLTSNPSTTEGVTDLVATGHWDKASWKPLFIASTEETERFLRSKIYTTAPKLQEHVENPNLETFDTRHALDTNKSVHDWKPTTLRIPSLISLIIYLVLFAVGISILYDYATGNHLYQKLFVDQVEIGEIAGHVARLTPFSIVPTFMAVILGMWWDAIQQKFCQLQPFIAMTRPEGTQWKDGPGMHYSTTNWVKSSVRATNSSFQLSTTWLQSVDLSEKQIKGFSTEDLERVFPIVMPDLYWAEDSKWLFNAANKLVHRGEDPVWSMNGWTLTPAELPPSTEDETTSISTQAIRARAECSPTSEGYAASDLDSWLLTYDLTNETAWNVSSNPGNLQTGYFIGNITSFDLGDGFFPFCANASGGVLNGAMWSDFTANKSERFPYRFSQWPINFTANWIQGFARSDIFTRNNFTHSLDSYDERIFPFTMCDHVTEPRFNLTMFTEIPKFQSVNCKPVIESANARATVLQDGSVISLELLDDPQPIDDPWKDVFVMYTHNSSDENYAPSSNSRAERNLTSSYGIYFLSSLLKAYSVGFESDDDDVLWGFDELYPDANEGTNYAYFINDDYSGMDLMSYCVYTLADRNATALLTNATLFSELVDTTFQTFFAHFITGDSNSTTRRGFQKVGETMPDLGRKVVYDADSALLKQEDPDTYPVSNTNKMVDGQNNQKVQLLKMNRAVTWLSFAILISLLLITVTIMFLHRRFLSPLHRNVESMADIMLLVAGSDHLLALVKERGVQALREDDTLLVRLGWFRSDNGRLRWGIEVLESGEAPAGQGKGMDVVWEDGNGSRSQSKWERYFTFSACRAIYNIFFHPLAKFPGPKLRAAFYFPHNWDLFTGNIAHSWHDLHEQYGEVVRVSPTWVSFINPDAWRDIYGYGNKKPIPKDPVVYNTFQNKPRIANILSSNDADHSRIRRCMNHAFSDQALRNQEPIINSYINLLISQLHAKAKSNTSVDIMRYINFTTFDILGDLCFGESFGALDAEEYNEWMANLFKGVKLAPVVRIAKQYPIIGLPFFLLTKLFPQVLEARVKHDNYTVEKTAKRIEKETDRKDFMRQVHSSIYILKHNDEKGMTRDEIMRTSGVLIVAGSETSATLLSGAVYYLLQNPTWIHKAQQELDSTFKAESDMTFASLSQLKVLNAILTETFRMYPPVPVILPRATIEESAMTMAWLELRAILANLLWHFDMEMVDKSYKWDDQKVFILWDKPALMVNLKARNH